MEPQGIQWSYWLGKWGELGEDLVKKDKKGKTDKEEENDMKMINRNDQKIVGRI